MNTNRHEGLRGEAALECGGLTPPSGARLLVVKFERRWRIWRTNEGCN
jgi:hypothetical protein